MLSSIIIIVIVVEDIMRNGVSLFCPHDLLSKVMFSQGIQLWENLFAFHIFFLM